MIKYFAQIKNEHNFLSNLQNSKKPHAHKFRIPDGTVTYIRNKSQKEKCAFTKILLTDFKIYERPLNDSHTQIVRIHD